MTKLLSLNFYALAVLLSCTSTTALRQDDFPLPFPGFRYVTWSNLSPARQVLASTAGWDETSWNLPGNATHEGLSLDSITDAAQKGAIEKLGFTEDQYDCFVNHYSWYDWSELVEAEVATYLEALGWTNESWVGNIMEPASENKTWAELTTAEQTAAYGICYFEGTWDELDIATMDVPIVYPDIRYQPWSDLSDTEQASAIIAGWSESTWNAPGTADHEDLAFSSLTSAQRAGLTSMGFYEEQYDCYVNHYDDYDWLELQQFSLSVHFEALGWTQASWDGTTSPPASDDKEWSELTAAEKAAAEQVCYTESTWNEEPLVPGASSGVMTHHGVSVVASVFAVGLGWTMLKRAL